MKGKLFALIAALMLALCVSAQAADESITVFYTNDIHTYINNISEDEHALTYSKVAALKDSVEDALLVDAGDHVQGTAYGGMDKGATMIKLMNAAGYDAAVMGNHEFDYGMARALEIAETADYPYLSCNFCALERDELVLESSLLVERGGKTLAFVGINTPETMTSTAPVTYQNEAGEYIYDFSGDSLCEAVQTAVDEARAAGADYVIALGHLGIDLSSVPWTSREVIAATTGIDVFIDGHSHTVMEGERVKNKVGEDVILTQTGEYFGHVGKLTIAGDGSITTELLGGEDLTELTPKENVVKLEQQWVRQLEEKLGEVIGYTEVTLDNYDADGNRLVRRQETNTGDFAADALRYYFENLGLRVDAAVMNGGGIRNGAITGEISYLTCKQIHTFGNIVCLIRVSGQQLLDLLEWGVHELRPDGTVEDGTFLHPSGMRYTVDLTVPSTVQEDDGMWTGGPTGEYRVKNLEIWDNEAGAYRAVDLTATYHLAGQNYTLRNQGGGCAMLKGAENVLDYAAEDYMVLAEYVRSFPVSAATGLPTITAADGYGDVYGSGRVTMITEKTENEEAAAEYVVQRGDSLWAIARRHYGRGSDWQKIHAANTAVIADPNLIFVGQKLILP